MNGIFKTDLNLETKDYEQYLRSAEADYPYIGSKCDDETKNWHVVRGINVMWCAGIKICFVI